MPKTFRNLPITAEQDAEIRAYIARCEAEGCSWDTLALDYMINEFLYPSPSDDRIDFCDEYAVELVNHVHRTGEALGCERQKLDALANGISETEWTWIVREAKRTLAK